MDPNSKAKLLSMQAHQSPTSEPSGEHAGPQPAAMRHSGPVSIHRPVKAFQKQAGPAMAGPVGAAIGKVTGAGEQGLASKIFGGAKNMIGQAADKIIPSRAYAAAGGASPEALAAARGTIANQGKLGSMLDSLHNGGYGRGIGRPPQVPSSGLKGGGTTAGGGMLNNVTATVDQKAIDAANAAISRSQAASETAGNVASRNMQIGGAGLGLGGAAYGASKLLGGGAPVGNPLDVATEALTPPAQDPSKILAPGFKFPKFPTTGSKTGDLAALAGVTVGPALAWHLLNRTKSAPAPQAESKPAAKEKPKEKEKKPMPKQAAARGMMDSTGRGPQLQPSNIQGNLDTRVLAQMLGGYQQAGDTWEDETRKMVNRRPVRKCAMVLRHYAKPMQKQASWKVPGAGQVGSTIAAGLRNITATAGAGIPAAAAASPAAAAGSAAAAIPTAAAANAPGLLSRALGGAGRLAAGTAKFPFKHPVATGIGAAGIGGYELGSHLGGGEHAAGSTGMAGLPGKAYDLLHQGLGDYTNPALMGGGALMAYMAARKLLGGSGGQEEERRPMMPTKQISNHFAIG